MFSDTHFTDEDSNPIDSLENVLNGYNWVFDRMNEEELFVKLSGKKNEYNVHFLWNETSSLLQVYCQYELKIAPANLQIARDTMMRLNEALHLGHFYMPEGTLRPGFRYSAFMATLSPEQAQAIVNNLVDTSLLQCERYAQAFTILSTTGEPCRGELELALMETQGQS